MESHKLSGISKTIKQAIERSDAYLVFSDSTAYLGRTLPSGVLSKCGRILKLCFYFKVVYMLKLIKNNNYLTDMINLLDRRRGIFEYIS